MRYIISRARDMSLSVDIQLKLFDALVIPITTYGVEVWGMEKTKLLDQLELQYCKSILNIKNSTPNYMVRGRIWGIKIGDCMYYQPIWSYMGEFGKLPVSIMIELRTIGFWANMVRGEESKLTNMLYSILVKTKILNGLRVVKIFLIAQDCPSFETCICLIALKI